MIGAGIDVEALATALAPKIAQLTDPEALWSTAQVADYLGVGISQARDRFMKAADFPSPIRLPTPSGTGRAQPRWLSREVREWAMQHQERSRR